MPNKNNSSKEPNNRSFRDKPKKFFSDSRKRLRNGGGLWRRGTQNALKIKN